MALLTMAPTGPSRFSTRLSPVSNRYSLSAPSSSASSVGECVTTANVSSAARAIRMMPRTSCLRWRESPAGAPFFFFFDEERFLERERVELTGSGGRPEKRQNRHGCAQSAPTQGWGKIPRTSWRSAGSLRASQGVVFSGSATSRSPARGTLLCIEIFRTAAFSYASTMRPSR